MTMTAKKMKVEIWSDISCPFCYIGKRKFETALARFNNADAIEIVWKSFELVPGFKTDPGKNMHQLLAELKGISLDQSVSISDVVAGSAKEVGLVYNFHKTVPANSFNAHRFSHLAKDHDLQDKAKESLFKAYFTDGKNIDTIATLAGLGEEIGLDPTEVTHVLESGRFAKEVNRDIHEAQILGITSVPTFVFGGKLTVSGAVESEAFLEILEETFTEWRLENPIPDIIATEGQSCSVDQNC
jgi:predicted DsbA family dithiol-disulfide isomerase